MSEIKCQYCKQNIEENNTICPYCSSKLKKEEKQKKNNTKMLFIIGVVLSVIWMLISALCVVFLNSYPDIFTAKDKDGLYIFLFSDYIYFLLFPVAFIIAPYIMLIINKERRMLGIIGIVVNLIFALSCSIYVNHLLNLYR